MKVISTYLLSLTLFITLGFEARAQSVSFEKLEELQKSENRIVMVLIKTEWCRYCNSMEHSMLSNPQISELLKRKFYFVILDGEEKRTIKFAGRNFVYKPTGKNTGVHELATELGAVNGQVSYPAICFLNPKNEIIYQHAGYLEPAALVKVIKTVSEY